MSFATPETAEPTPILRYAAGPAEYFALLKPRVMSLVVFTALGGLLVAPVSIHPVVAFASLLAIAVGAGAAGALNMWWDADIDSMMSRTRSRPVPSGRIKQQEACAFGLILSFFAVLTLAVVANLVAAGLLAFTIFFYVVVYTMWLKRRTPQNIVIGGAAGALPPVVGYAAATGSVSIDSLILFAIIFVWTPPHFWSLALAKSEDYARAGVPMMPNVKGEAHTRLEILLYTMVLCVVAIAPWPIGIAGRLYAAVVIAADLAMIRLAYRVYRTREGKEAHRAAIRLFGLSIFYLFTLFACLAIEHALNLIDRFGL